MNRWILGARPRTLPAAVVPVAVGVAVAVGDNHGTGIIWWRAGAALVVALALQIATNFANDYSDGVKGTDTVRVGPTRLVGSGLASPAAVKTAALATFAAAAVVGGALVVAVGPELIVVGALSIGAGWFYTGGPKPYGYYGLGELFVFVFFGVVATAGTTYVLSEQLTGLALAASVPVGCLACALLVVNNLRDIPTDTEAGKRTLAVRLGAGATRRLYVGLIAVAFAVGIALAWSRLPVLLVMAALPAAVAPVKAVLRGAHGGDLIPVLGATGRLQLAFGLLLAVGLAWGG